jgi:hypothetical protein
MKPSHPLHLKERLGDPRLKRELNLQLFGLVQCVTLRKPLAGMASSLPLQVP